MTPAPTTTACSGASATAATEAAPAAGLSTTRRSPSFCRRCRRCPRGRCDGQVIAKVVAGRFQLLAEAGSGGMGTVYRARDLTDGATVAVKILTGREAREAVRFEQEAAILAGLPHPA